MRILASLLLFAALWTPAESLPDDKSISVPILDYHRFAPVAAGSTTVTTATLEYQLDYLSKQGFTVVSLHALVDRLREVGPALPPHAVVITVDDGHKSVYTDMLPVIRRYRVPVTLFIYPSAISNASYALTWDELKELKDTGLFDIQSHTYWHPNFNEERRRLNDDQYAAFVEKQLSKSKQELESRLRTKVDLLAWPFGIFNDLLITKATQAGYIAAFALGSRAATNMDGMMSLPRYLMSENDKGARLKAILGKNRKSGDPTYWGTVIDGVSRRPIDGAIVTLNNTVTMADGKGAFRISGDEGTVRVRAPGYLRLDLDGQQNASQPLQIELTPFKPKALYLSLFGIGSSTLRDPALKLIHESKANALVVDVKGDRGLVSFNTSIPLAQAVGAEKEITIRDIHALMASFKQQRIYTIARIVVFKDEPLASARQDLAVKTPNGEIWRDREHLAWTNPFSREVWDYNIALAVEAARAGFDEIQFDYVRFPDAAGLSFSSKDIEENRLAAITGFLREARQKLVPYNVFLSADVFGYVCWNLDDTGVGQRLEQLALSLEKALQRTGISPLRFRPWLQAFQDYAFDRRPFGTAEIQAQIEAVEHFGSDGWMLWNPHNVYSLE